MEVEQEFGNQVQFIGVPSLSQDIGSMTEFVNDTGSTNFHQVPDVEGVIWNQFGITAQRTYVYINNDGTWRSSGYGSLREDVQNLIAQ